MADRTLDRCSRYWTSENAPAGFRGDVFESKLTDVQADPELAVTAEMLPPRTTASSLP